MATEVGEVEVVLRARISQLEADLKKAEGKTKTTSRKMRDHFRSIGGAVKKLKGGIAGIAAIAMGVAGGALMGLAKQAIRTANDIGDTAQKLGVTTGALQEFQYAANQSGVASQTLNMGLQRFGRRAAEAANGTGEARDAIRALNIELRDGEGNLRKTEDLFTDAMTALSEIESPLERIRLGFKLFDSEGVALVNMAGDMGSLRDEAQRLGIVLDDEVIQRSDELQDSFDSLWAVTKGQLTPALVDLGGSMMQSTLETMAELAGWANKIYRSFADTSNLGLSNLYARQIEAQEELTEAYTEYQRLKEEVESSGMDTESYGPLITLKNDSIALAQELIKIKERLGILKEAREKAEGGLTGAGAGEGKTAEEEKRAEAERLKAIESRKRLAQKAHDEFLEQTGQRIRLVDEQLERDKAALEENLEANENYQEAIGKLEWTAAMKKDEIREEAAEKEKKRLEGEKGAYQDLFDFMEDGFSDALATMLLTGEMTFKSLAQSFAREFLQKGISKILGQFFDQIGGGLFGSGGASAGGATPSANGGWRSSGGPLLVGERGPELFIPSTSGFVANNQTLSRMGSRSSSGVNVTVINNSGEESTTTERQGPNGTRDIEVMIGKAVKQNIERGGDVDQAIRNSYGVNRVGRHGL